MRPDAEALANMFKGMIEEECGKLKFNKIKTIRVGIHYNGFGPEVNCQTFTDEEHLYGDIDVEDNEVDKDNIGEEIYTALNIAVAEYTEYDGLIHMLYLVCTGFAVEIGILYKDGKHDYFVFDSILMEDIRMYDDADAERLLNEFDDIDDDYSIEDEYGDDVAEDDTNAYEDDYDEYS